MRQRPYDVADDSVAQRSRKTRISAREIHRRVSLVTGETLVASVAIQRHGYVGAGLSRYIVAGYRGRIGKRFAVVLDQRRQNLERIRPHDELVMIGADVLGDAPRM